LIARTNMHGREFPGNGAAPIIDCAHAFGRLRACEQRAVACVYRDDMTYPDAALKTGMPLGTFKRVLRHARENLRRSLDGHRRPSAFPPGV
jgi:DNA-directed RNA polymerase specialized sigma24 family protein